MFPRLGWEVFTSARAHPIPESQKRLGRVCSNLVCDNGPIDCVIPAQAWCILHVRSCLIFLARKPWWAECVQIFYQSLISWCVPVVVGWSVFPSPRSLSHRHPARLPAGPVRLSVCLRVCACIRRRTVFICSGVWVARRCVCRLLVVFRGGRLVSVPPTGELILARDGNTGCSRYAHSAAAAAAEHAYYRAEDAVRGRDGSRDGRRIVCRDGDDLRRDGIDGPPS